MDSRSTLEINTLLVDSFRVLGCIGAGGFGITYLAEDIHLTTMVAIKEYYPDEFGARAADMRIGPKSERHRATFEWGRAGFLREAQMLARFRHPSIVRVARVFEANSTAYMVMDFEQGQSLGAWLTALGRPPAQEELDRIADALLSALEVMHGASFLHRDIAPDNIIIRPDGTPVLLDFGAARRAVAEQSRSLTGIVKAGYSPQEQYATDGRLQGPWSDLYALGATFYRAVTGRPPEEATVRMVDDRTVPAMQAAEGAYRPQFLAAIDACLNVDRKKRPQSARDLRGMLLPGPAAQKAPAVSVAANGLNRGRPESFGLARVRRWAAGAGAALLLLSGGYALYDQARQSVQERDRVASEAKRKAEEADRKRTADEALEKYRADEENKRRRGKQAEQDKRAQEERDRQKAEAERQQQEAEKKRRDEEAARKKAEAEAWDREQDEADARRKALAGPVVPLGSLKDFTGIWANSAAGCAVIARRGVAGLDKPTRTQYVPIGICEKGIEFAGSNIGCDVSDITKQSEDVTFAATCRRKDTLMEPFRTGMRVRGRDGLAFNEKDFQPGGFWFSGHYQRCTRSYKCDSNPASFSNDGMVEEQWQRDERKVREAAEAKNRQEEQSEAPDAAPLRMVRYIYERMANFNLRELDDPARVAHGDVQRTRKYFTPQFIDVLRQSYECLWTPGKTGLEMWARRRDYTVSDVDVRVAERTSTTQAISARFKSDGKEERWSFKFRLTPKGWLIEDALEDGRSLTQLMAKGCGSQL